MQKSFLPLALPFFQKTPNREVFGVFESGFIYCPEWGFIFWRYKIVFAHTELDPGLPGAAPAHVPWALKEKGQRKFLCPFSCAVISSQPARRRFTAVSQSEKNKKNKTKETFGIF